MAPAKSLARTKAGQRRKRSSARSSTSERDLNGSKLNARNNRAAATTSRLKRSGAQESLKMRTCRSTMCIVFPHDQTTLETLPVSKQTLPTEAKSHLQHVARSRRRDLGVAVHWEHFSILSFLRRRGHKLQTVPWVQQHRLPSVVVLNRHH